MNFHHSTPSTPFQDRNLDALPSHTPTSERPPAWFSTEPDGGDRLDGILRSLLVVCLLVSMVLCGLHLQGVVQTRDAAFASPAPATAMTTAQPPAVQSPVACADSTPHVAL